MMYLGLEIRFISQGKMFQIYLLPVFGIIFGGWPKIEVGRY